MEHLAFSKRIMSERPLAFFQQITLCLLLFTTYSARQVLGHHRNETYVHEVALATRTMPIWNEKVEKIQGKCLRFHNSRVPELFYYWPEDSNLVHHCCFQVFNGQNLSTARPEFKYSKYGEPLGYASYRDVGYFDQCFPFWQCRQTYLQILHTQVHMAYCERTDLTRLYWRRFWYNLVGNYSLLRTLIPWICILETVLVLLAVAVFPLTWKHAGESPSKASGWHNLGPTGRIWLKSTWKRLLLDWGHMYLLSMVGNGIVEVMGRQDIYSMQTKLFKYSTLYLVLFVIVSAASGLQQLAYWIGSATDAKVLNYWVKKNEAAAKANEGVPQHPAVNNARPSPLGKPTPKVTFAVEENDHPVSPATNTATIVLTPRPNATTHHGGSSALETDTQPMLKDDSRSDSYWKRFFCCSWCLFPHRHLAAPAHKLKRITRSFRKYLSGHVFDMGDEYKWQPLATQGAIAIASFLKAPVGDDAEGSRLFGSLLGFMVQAGALWSGIYAVVVTAERLGYIFRFFKKLWNGGGGDAGETPRYLEFRGAYQVHSKLPV